LKALALLDKARETTPADVRFSLEDEPHVEDSFVRFIFAFDESEIDQVYENIAKGVLRKNVNILIKKGNREVELKSICRSISIGHYVINVPNSVRISFCPNLPKNIYEVGSEWKIPSKTIPAGYLIETKGEQKLLKDFLLINANDFPEVPESYFLSATIDDVEKIIRDEVKHLIDDKLTDCVYWSYSEQNLLPASIPLNAFSNNPLSCIPLKNMFELAGIENIQEAISSEQVRTNGLRNLLGRVAKQTTQHIKSVWKDYQSIEILLEPNGVNIDASVREGFNRHEFASRSDGFKRFVSFLIMVSAKVKTNQLEDTLLLIDEPEIGLHPSGARHLKDELLKISEKNHVVYSTHSIFMVDKENIGRHLLVKKQNEVTVTAEASKSNFVDEEVIYNALGYSIFDNLKETNILFEGWRDKKLFQVALENTPKPHKHLKSEFQKMGIANLQGVKDVGRVCPILELANRDYIIISDCDEVAKAEQKKFTGSGLWKRWDELSDDAEIVTGEDFIKADHITSVVSRIKAQHPQLSVLPDTLNLSSAGGKLHCIDRWVGSAMVKDEKKAFLNQVKDELVNSLTHGDIEEHFYSYLQALLEHVAQPES